VSRHQIILGLALASWLGTWGAWLPEAEGFRISSPQEGLKVEAGSAIQVTVDPEGAGPLVGVLFDAAGGGQGFGGDFDVLPPYTWTLKIPKEYVGSLTVSAAGQVLGQKTGQPPQAKVTIMVMLPAATTLKRLRVDNDQEDLFLRPGMQMKIYVYGQYSDGVERPISSTDMGTTYTISDEKVIAIDSNGRVSALSPGKAQITVRNGTQALIIHVTVKPKL